MNARRFLVIAVLLVACGFAGGLVIVARMHADEEAVAQPSPQARPAVTAPPVAAPGGSLPDFTRIAERSVPAVVNVSLYASGPGSTIRSSIVSSAIRTTTLARGGAVSVPA